MCFCLQLYGNQRSIVDGITELVSWRKICLINLRLPNQGAIFWTWLNDLSAWLIFVLISQIWNQTFLTKVIHCFLSTMQKKNCNSLVTHSTTRGAWLHSLHTNHTIDTISMSNLKQYAIYNKCSRIWNKCNTIFIIFCISFSRAMIIEF